MISEADYFGNPLVGMFLRTGENITLVPNNTPDELLFKVESVLSTEIVKARVYSSHLLGLFTVFNSKGLVVPDVAYSSEEEHLSNYFDNIVTMRQYTAVGNLIALNDDHALVSPVVPDDVIENIRFDLDVDVHVMKIAGLDVTGSLIYLTNDGFILTSLASDEELSQFQDILGIEGVRTTLNYGNPMVSSGILANSNGALVGSETTPFEMGRVDEALFLR